MEQSYGMLKESGHGAKEGVLETTRKGVRSLQLVSRVDGAEDRG